MKSITTLTCLFIVSLFFNSCGYSLQNTNKDNSHIYLLPFEEGKKVLMIQAYKSLLSHRREVALDFKIKKGTRICASREGIVIAVKEHAYKHGVSAKFLAEGNHIIIQHDDGSFAWYWHLQQNGVDVNLGDKIEAGQYIGRSGHTGFSAFPHLHFEVRDNKGKQIPTRFYTQKGIEYLRPGHFYKSVRP